MKAPLPENEAERLAALNSSGLLDSNTEDFFDRITRVAANVLEVPIALVSLVDAERQWFKSAVGISAKETHRDSAFCAHAILDDGPLIIENATEDTRFLDNPLVTGEPNIRFYIGVPIKSLAGYQLGTLCAIDDKPRELTSSQVDVLTDLAQLVTQEIQNREQVINSLKKAKSSEMKFQSVFDNAAIGIALVTPQGSWLQVNDDLCKIVGYSKEELADLTFQDITYPDDLDKDLHLLGQLVMGEIERYTMEKRYVRKDGSLIWIALNVTKQLDVNGEIDYFIAIVKDIHVEKEAKTSLLKLKNDLEERVLQRTEELSQANLTLNHALEQRVADEKSLKSSEFKLKMIIEHANDAYVGMDSDGLVTDWNQQAEATFGWAEVEMLGQRFDTLIATPEQKQNADNHELTQYLKLKKPNTEGKTIEFEAAKKNGETIPVELQIISLEINGKLIFSAFLRDITDRKKLAQILQSEARNDLLTGLPNRRKLEELLPMVLERANKNKSTIGLLFIDLDGFKFINDTYGHDAGDMVLREVANRLDKLIRRTDAVARFAGDEFIIILDGVRNGVEDIQLLSDKVLEALRAPIKLSKEKAASVSGSIGIAIYTGGESRVASHDVLIKAADTAMYTAKTRGKNQYYISEDQFL